MQQYSCVSQGTGQGYLIQQHSCVIPGAGQEYIMQQYSCVSPGEGHDYLEIFLSQPRGRTGLSSNQKVQLLSSSCGGLEPSRPKVILTDGQTDGQTDGRTENGFKGVRYCCVSQGAGQDYLAIFLCQPRGRTVLYSNIPVLAQGQEKII